MGNIYFSGVSYHISLRRFTIQNDAMAHSTCTEVFVAMALLFNLCNSLDCHDLDEHCLFSFTRYDPVNPH